MAFRFQLNQKKGIVLLSVASLLILALLYFFVYIPENEKQLTARRFRSMQRLERNIQSKVENTFALLQQNVDAIVKGDYTEQEIRQNLKARFDAEAKGPVFLDNRYQVKQQLGDEDGSRQRQVLVSDRNIIFSIRFEHADGRKDTIEMQYNVDVFLKPLLPEFIFDEYIVLCGNKVLWQTFASGLSEAEGADGFDSLAAINKKLIGASLHKLNVGGNGYRIFSQPFVLADGDKHWIAIGLLEERKFQAERNKLPADQVVGAITIGLLLIVLLPWIKLWLMAPRDKLTYTDGVLSFIVAMLMMSLLSYGFAQFQIQHHQNQQQEARIALARQMDNTVNQFVDSVDSILNGFSEIFARNPKAQRSLVKIFDDDSMAVCQFNNDKNVKANVLDTTTKKSIQQHFDPIINRAFWLAAERKAGYEIGDEIATWTLDEQDAPRSNFAKRPYFQNVAEGKKDRDLEPVLSWSSGTFRTVRSKADTIFLHRMGDSLKVVACLSINMRPLQNHVLPDSYEFAVLTRQGEVKYHSDSTRNLNENLPQELDRTGALQTALRYGIPYKCKAEYHGEQVMIQTLPMTGKNLDWSLVIMEKQVYTDIRNAGAFSFTLVMILGFFALVVMQLVVVALFSSRPSPLKRMGHEVNWIWPKSTAHEVYCYSSVFNLMVALTLVLNYRGAGFTDFFMSLLLAINIITIFMNHLLARLYRQMNQLRLYRYKLRSLTALYVLWLLTNLVTARISPSFFGSTAFRVEGVALIVGVIVYIIYSRFYAAIPVWQNTLRDQRRYLSSYMWMATSRLIITSAIPVFFFYQHAYNYETNIVARSMHSAYLKKAGKAIVAQQESPVEKLPEKYLYTDTYWIDTILQNDTEQEDTSAKLPFEPSLFHRLRPYTTAMIKGMDLLASADTISKQIIHSRHWLIQTQANHRTVYLNESKGKKQRVGIHSAGIYLYWPGFPDRTSILFWLLFGVAVWAFTRLLVKVKEKIFALNLPGENGNQWAPDQIKMATQRRLYYIAGLPGSGKLAFAKSFAAADEPLVVDLFGSMPPKWKFQDCEVVMLNHFEYLVAGLAQCESIIGLLEHLFTISNRPAVILLSTLDQNTLLEQLSATLANVPPAKRLELTDKLQILLGHFKMMVLPIIQEGDREKTAELTNTVSPPKQEDKLVGTITPGLPENEDYSFTKMFADDTTRDDEIWRNQTDRSAYYGHIWQSLGAEERYLVYDLAEDGLVNKSNSFHLALLLRKGLVRRKENSPQLELMSEAFENYVLTVVDKKEIQAVKMALRSDDSWNDLRTPMLIAVIGILVILVASQQQAYTKIVGYITAVAGIIPTLGTILNFIRTTRHRADFNPPA